jgi:hypothetical protein
MDTIAYPEMRLAIYCIALLGPKRDVLKADKTTPLESARDY